MGVVSLICLQVFHQALEEDQTILFVNSSKKTNLRKAVILQSTHLFVICENVFLEYQKPLKCRDQEFNFSKSILACLKAYSISVEFFFLFATLA